MKSAIYPGTFDPCTVAHIDILRRASLLFDFVHVGVLINTSKRPIFTVKERVEMLETCASCEGITNCKVTAFDGMLVDFAEETGAYATIRGLRNGSDFDAELAMYDINKLLNAKLETVFLMANKDLRAISSSAVREIGKCGGSLKGFVHDAVLNKITERLGQL